MIVSIHQPNYIPWLGYFYKIWASDVFVLLDNVQYNSQSFTKRVFVRKNITDADHSYISVPIIKHHRLTNINDLVICNRYNWREKHLNKIYNSYHKAPNFDLYFPQIKHSLLASNSQLLLSEINETMIFSVLDILGIQKNIVRSSDLPIKDVRKDDLTAAITLHLGGTAYLSGVGAKKYQHQETYDNQKIELIFSDLGSFMKTHPPQYPVAFDSSFSILDALFYIGKEGVLQLFEAYRDSEMANSGADYSRRGN